ncbi:hypothetical protein KY359_06055 [Candidatus Woesearchaeota archaeon]|nr:hypothetical protein [Candidatus Woesearchaeota archaeon]
MRFIHHIIFWTLVLLASAVQVAALTQTDIIYSMDDTYVNSSASTTNFNGNGLTTGKEGADTYESWFKFNLADPSGYYVTAAVLRTYVYSATNSKDYYIENASSASWTETDLTWDNKPSYGTSLAQNTISAAGWYSWAITGTYSSKFNAGTDYVAYVISETGPATASIRIEDGENSKATGNIPYLNLTMMVPEVHLLSPADPYSTYDTTLTFQYNTTDAGNIANCSIIFDGSANKTNTTVGTNTTSSFTISGISVGDHTWAIRCYDVNRYTYEINPETRDLTILASVEWYNPSSATRLDLGSVVKGGATLTGSRQIYANNSNTGVQVSCTGGDCGVISTNWTTTGITGGETKTAGFSCPATTAGSFEADFELTSDQDASADTLTVNCTILAPDLRINATNITFSDSTPTEDQEIDISAGIYNDGTYGADDFVVRFYDGHYSAGTQIGSDHTINLSAGQHTTVTQNWTTTIGSHDIYVAVDPPVDTNGSIDEGDETNNYAYNTIDISMWTYFVGNVTGSLALQTEDNSTVIKWDVTDTTSSIIYVMDTDSSPSFSSLAALSRNTTGSYMADDFTELDDAIGTTAYPDSVNLTFTSAGSPLATETFKVFGISVDEVPVVDSTNSSTFITGILWDTSDDSNSNHQYDNTSKEDIVFVTRVNQSKTGMYGTYDYEIRVPARLRSYKGPDTLTVTFYTEIK